MSFLMKFFDRLSESEKEDALQTMSDLYGPLFFVSLCFPIYNRSKLPITLVNIGVTGSLTLGHFFLMLITLWKELLDFNLFCLLLHHTMLVAFYIVALVSMNYNRKLNSENHVTMGKNWGKYRFSNVYEDETVKRITKELNQELYLYLAIPAGVVVLAGSSMAIPYLFHYAETRVTKSGVNRNLLFPCYYPFPSDRGLLHLLVMVLQLSTVSSIALFVITLLLSFLRLAQRVRLEFRVASYVLETLITKSAELYKQKYSSSENGIDDPYFQSCVGLVLKDVLVHHHTIVNLATGLNDIGSWITAMAFAAGSGSIGLSLISILSALSGENYENMVVFTLLLVSEVANIFVLCVIGEAITTDSEKFHQQLYFIEWYDLNVPNRKTLLNLQVGSHQPYVMRAGGLVDANHDTFSSIMNAAYSFFNIMNVNGVE